jgi:hypothetical protein
MSRAHWCRHYGYRDGPLCGLGLDLSEPGKARRCMPVPPPGPRCPSREDLSAEEIQAHEDRSRQAATDALMVMACIPQDGDGGAFPCPACRRGMVSWNRVGETCRARSLGVRAACSMPGCVRFMS